MGCFLACFGGAKDRPERRHRSKRSPPIRRVPVQANSSPEKLVVEQVTEVSLPVPELREKQEQGSFPSSRKKVTFDLNVKTYESVADEGEEEEEVSTDPTENEEGNLPKVQGKLSPIGGAFPLNHRYGNCQNSDDEDDGNVGDYLDDDCEYSDLEDEEDDVGVVCTEEESYDSFFSLPMDQERQQESCVEEVDSPIPVSVSTKASARDRSQYVHSVLNPVENLSQWREAKVRAVPLKNTDKENCSFSSETLKTPNKENKISPIIEVNNKTPQKPVKEEISVDASLSSWLLSSESLLQEDKPKKSNSNWSNLSVSREEQPILGALTVEDLKHSSSVTSSPRRSPIRNPDEMPILGTMGSYWICRTQNSDTKGVPNTTSKYREDMRVNWYSTPFEVRLERALNKGVAAAACPR